MLKALTLAILLCTTNVYAIDVMFIFTPSGLSETTGAHPAYTALEGVNDTFEQAYDRRPFTLLASYYQATGARYTDTQQMHRELVKNGSSWARKTRFQSLNAGADITVVIWGLEDNTDERSAGMARCGSHYALVRGKHLGDDYIVEHELGHELCVPKSDNLTSIMSEDDTRNRQSFTEGEIALMFEPLIYADNNALRRAKCVGRVIHEVEYPE